MNPRGREIDNGAATCLDENLAFDRFFADFEKHLTGHSLEFYRDWRAA